MSYLYWRGEGRRWRCLGGSMANGTWCALCFRFCGVKLRTLVWTSFHLFSVSLVSSSSRVAFYSKAYSESWYDYACLLFLPYDVSTEGPVYMLMLPLLPVLDACVALLVLPQYFFISSFYCLECLPLFITAQWWCLSEGLEGLILDAFWVVRLYLFRVRLEACEAWRLQAGFGICPAGLSLDKVWKR